MDLIEQVLNIFLDAITTTGFLLQSITAHHLDGIILKVTTTHHQANRYTLHLVVGKLEARTLVVSIVVLHTDTHATQLVHNAFNLSINLLQLVITLINRHNHHLYRSQFWRQHQTIVVTVRHNECTHQAS